MDFYFVEKDFAIELPIDGERVTYVFLVNDPQRITADRLYFAPSDEIQRVVERFDKAGYSDFEVKVFLDKRQIFEHPKFPLNLTYSGGYLEKNETFVPLEEKIKPLLGKEKIRVAIVNGMGGGIGDNIVGMTALNIFYDRLMRHFREVSIGIFTLRPRAIPILRQETIVDEIYLMPAPAELLFQYDALVDLSNMTGWPIFKQEMVDFYLQAMSMDPQEIPSEEKRCFVKINERVARELEPVIKALKCSGRPLLLFHPLSSSAIRSVPKKIIPKMLRSILEKTNYLIVSLLPVEFKHARFVRLDQFSRKGFDHFAYLISQMDAVITVDTAVYHVADAFSVPTVVLFTSIPPEHRISYYPFQKGFLIGGKNGEPLFYRHASEKEEEIRAFAEAWEKFRIDKALEALEELREIRRRIETKPCPVCENEVPFIPTDRYRTYRHLKCDQCEAEFAWPRKGYDYNQAYEQGKSDVAQYDHYISSLDPEKSYLGYISNIRFQKVREFLEQIPSKKTLLDIGCANGFFVRYAREIGFQAYGLDASASAIEWGEKHFGLRGYLVTGQGLEDLPLHFPKKFQVITAFEVIEHLEEPLDFVQKIYEKLEEGGLFIFSTPNRKTTGRILGVKDERVYFIGGERDEPPDHLSRFTGVSHKKLLEKAGFKILWQCTVPPLPGDLFRALGDELKIPNLTVKIDSEREINITGDKLKPFISKAFEALRPALFDQGLFLITAAVKN